MSRIYGSQSGGGDVERTDTDWEMSGIYSDFARERLDRDDVVVRVGRSTVSGAPGAWWTEEGVIELNGSLVDVDGPVDLHTDAGKARVAAVHGVALHEISHAAHSQITFDDDTDPRAAQLAMLLEESRIEARVVDDDPDDAVWLRAAVETILDPDEATDPTAAALLLCARADAGVLTEDDIAPVRDRIVDAVGNELYDKMRDIWNRGIAAEDGDTAALVNLGSEWLDVLAEAGLEPPPSNDDGTGDGTGDGDGTGGAGLPGLAEAAAEAASRATAGAAADIDANVEIEEAANAAAADLDKRLAEAAEAAERDAARDRADKGEADKVFPPGHGLGRSGHTAAVVGGRPPTSAERAAAADLARSLEQTLWRPPSKTETRSILPPGRLHTSGAVALSAQLAQGKIPTAKPWKARRRVVDPPLTVRIGLAVDRSGSMNHVIGEACSAAWIVGNAAQRVGARFAAVTFGERTAALCRPGTYPSRVPSMRADAGFESIGSAVSTLSGALDLGDPRHVRLLVILSDAHWVEAHEDRQGRKRITELAGSDCHVVVAHAGPMKEVRDTKQIVFHPGQVAATITSELLGALRGSGTIGV